MIEHNTVFILGAGASVPYGYPTGNKLRHDIIFSAKGMLENLVNSNKYQTHNTNFNFFIK